MDKIYIGGCNVNSGSYKAMSVTGKVMTEGKLSSHDVEW